MTRGVRLSFWVSFRIHSIHFKEVTVLSDQVSGGPETKPYVLVGIGVSLYLIGSHFGKNGGLRKPFWEVVAV